MAELAYSFLKGNAVCKKGAQLCAVPIPSSPRIRSPRKRKYRFSGTKLATGYLSVPHRDMKKSGKLSSVN
jgi:hypothetical protein